MVFVGAGGAPDIIARLIGQALSQRIGQPVIIENRPGGGGNLSLQAVARAPADGHTLLLIATPHAVNVTLYEKQQRQPGARHRPDRQHQQRFIRHAGQSVDADQDRCRIHRPREIQPRQGQPDLERQRQPHPSVRRIVPHGGRHRDGSCAVPQHAGGADRADGGRSACHFRCAALGAAAREGRQPARARRDRARAREGASGHSRHSRDRCPATR